MKSWKLLFKIGKDAIVRNSPDILLTLGAITLAGSAIPAAIAAPKVIKLVQEKKEELGVEKLGALDIVKTVWRPCAGVIICWLIGGGCIIISRKQLGNKIVTYATAYAASEAALSEYRAAVVNELGEKKDKLITEKIAEEKVKNDHRIEEFEVNHPELGNCPCRFNNWGFIFESNFMDIKEGILKLNDRMLQDKERGPYVYAFISVNELLDEFGLDHIKGGDELGWDYDTTGIIKLSTNSYVDSKGRPILGIDLNDPIPFYDIPRG